MKSCRNCEHAEWKRTASGKLHPSGSGKCLKHIRAPVLPAAYGWIGGPPLLSGGFINRNEELKKDCPYFEWAPK